MNKQTSLPMTIVSIEPVHNFQWKVEGPQCILRVTLVDSGGWDVSATILREPEHYTMLHHALIRAYQLALGAST